MKLHVSARARTRARRVDSWWQEHRPAASTLFLDELAAAFELLLSSPEAGPVVDEPGANGARRLLLQKSQQHVYYWVDRKRDTLRIITVWGAKRGRLPSLRR